jgi:carboxymethylenebutenolidase
MQTPSSPSMPGSSAPGDSGNGSGSNTEGNAAEGNVTPVAPPDMAMPSEPSDPEANPAPMPGAEMAIATQAITFAGPRGVLQGAWASAAEPRGAVLVIHENRGLNDHIRSVAGRFAAAGYSALALDLLSEEGGTAALGDVANATAALGAAGQNPQRFVEDMRAAMDELERRVPGAAIGAIGFCFGGGMMWQLTASGDPRLAAVAPFYGPLPQGAKLQRVERRRARHLRRARRPRERDPRSGRRRVDRGGARARDRDLPGGEPCLSSTTAA